MIQYLKYYLTPFLASFGILGLYLGGTWMWSGLVIMAIVVIGGDFTLGADATRHQFRFPKLLNLPLYLALPLLSFFLLSLLWSCGSGTEDFLSLGSIFQNLTAYDVFAVREDNQWFHYLGAILSTGFAIASYGTNVAHELTHRIHEKFDLTVGKWILSMSMNADFAIEHVWGHHVRIGTKDDPATAREGETVYAFVIRSTIGSFHSAWEIEKKRLAKKQLQTWSWHNKVLRGHAMALCWISLFYFVAGTFGAIMFIGQAVFAKFILEVVNYLEHYGLTRDPKERVQPYHSWNANQRMSAMILFSLNRHSAHHEKGMLPFWKLDPYENVPHLPFGYLSMILISLFPPLWFKIMDPCVESWKKMYAPQIV